MGDGAGTVAACRRSRVQTSSAGRSGAAAQAKGGPRRSAHASLVDTPNFLLATRDSGYRTTAYAIAEFVDNSLQAGATSVSIDVLPSDDPKHPIEVLVVDNGGGMDEATLASSLTFGGSWNSTAKARPRSPLFTASSATNARP